MRVTRTSPALTLEKSAGPLISRAGLRRPGVHRQPRRLCRSSSPQKPRTGWEGSVHGPGGSPAFAGSSWESGGGYGCPQEIAGVVGGVRGAVLEPLGDLSPLGTSSPRSSRTSPHPDRGVFSVQQWRSRQVAVPPPQGTASQPGRPSVGVHAAFVTETIHSPRLDEPLVELGPMFVRDLARSASSACRPAAPPSGSDCGSAERLNRASSAFSPAIGPTSYPTYRYRTATGTTQLRVRPPGRPRVAPGTRPQCLRRRESTRLGRFEASVVGAAAQLRARNRARSWTNRAKAGAPARRWSPVPLLNPGQEVTRAMMPGW